MRAFLLLLVTAACCSAQLVPYVEAQVGRGDLSGAQNTTALFRQRYGTTPEVLAALSWLARGELNAHNYDKAIAEAEEVRDQVKASLAIRKLDSDPYTPLALGATYEVQAQALAALKRRSEALQFLQNAEHDWRGTSIIGRLQKNVLLLTLVGHPLPEIQGTPNVWKGKPVLLFFWAHWCPDCKADAPIISRLAEEFKAKGLVVVAPTRLYGYTAAQDTISAADEKVYIDQVFQHYYAIIPRVIVPVNASNFDRFGASTTPTIVLADRQGIVRLYHPGLMDEPALRDAIQKTVAATR